MRTIVVYGGAFNPPTNAHQKILQAGIDWVSIKTNPEAWIVPSGENNKKKTGIPRPKRLEYCQALIESCDTKSVLVRTELLELDDTEPTSKIETVQTLMRQNPDAIFWWIYGADSIETIDQWGGEWLKAHTSILIAPRDGTTVGEAPVGAEIMNVHTSGYPSSTIVRSMIVKGESIKDAVPQKVANAIDPLLYS